MLSEDLSKYLEAKRENYDACLELVEHNFKLHPKVSAALNLHFVKFDATGEPKFGTLAECLVDHIISYAISTSRRPNIDAVTAGRLFQEAKENFNLKDDSGEPGEVLLYFLLETVFKAPQLICKIALKTNKNDEVKGADGIHALWDDDQDKLVLFIGESKLHARFDSAVSDALASIDKFHSEGQLKRDLLLTTTHYKYAPDKAKEQITKLLDPKIATTNYKLIHVCLVGYDWSKYSDLTGDKRNELITEFQTLYLKNVESHRLETLQGHLDKFPKPHLEFHFLFLPFISVEEFRKAFNKILVGGTK